MARYAGIIGWGKYVPERVLTNDDLAKIVETSDEWIRTRTGIAQRHIVDPKEATSNLAIRAAQQALNIADFDPTRLDLIIVATCTPDYLIPNTACMVQDALGASKAGAFDLNAACSGFIYALSVASQMIVAGGINNALVIGAESLSRVLDWGDRNTCVLFGDGAGAVLLQATDTPSGVVSFMLGADGSGAELLLLRGGGSRIPACSVNPALNGHLHLTMNGPEVFRFATRKMGQVSKEVIDKAGLQIEDIELFVPHQANLRIIQSATKYLDLPEDRVFVNLDKYGNTSAASVPIALCEALENGRIGPGDHVAMVAFGAGLTWAGTVIQWGPSIPTQRGPWWRGLLQALRYVLGRFIFLQHRLERKLDVLLMRIDLRDRREFNGHNRSRSDNHISQK